MNKYQKEKSREIRDIMRSDRWGRMTYKEAKRKWRNGIRAFRVGDTRIWKAANLGHLGFSRDKMREVGQAYYKISNFCICNGYTLDCRYESCFGAYLLKFTGWLPDGRKYSMGHSVTSDVLRHCRGSLMDIAEYILNTVDREFTKLGYIPRRTTIADMHPPILRRPESLEPRMTLHPWDCRSPEAVFGKIIVKE